MSFRYQYAHLQPAKIPGSKTPNSQATMQLHNTVQYLPMLMIFGPPCCN